jgi:glycosyltransferase involved in cell wall biosynthesis
MPPRSCCATCFGKRLARNDEMIERPLSFCMITTFYPPYHFGGEAMYLYRLNNALARRGHRVTVVHCMDSYRLLRTSRSPRGEFPNHPNVTVHSLRNRLGWLSPLVTYLSGRPGLKSAALDRIFATERFDVVHFHMVTLFGPGVLRYGEGALRIYTTHDHWLVCPMYDLWKRNRELCLAPSCLACTLSYHRPPQLWRYTNLLDRELPRVDLFLSPSRSTIEQHQRRGFNYPMRHLPHFLPLAETAGDPPVRAARPRRPYFLFVGRLVKIKGVQTLMEAFRRFRDADLLIAGDGPYEQELRGLARGLEHVHFLGRVTPEELRPLYRDAIALLVPSLVYETFGFIVLESLGQRTPVIARDLGAVAELVRDTGGGITFRDEEELGCAMRQLRENQALRDELGSRGYDSYVARYSEERHVETYLGAIEELAAARGAAPAGV